MKTLREPKMPTSRPQAIFPAKQPTVKAKAKLPMTLGSIPLATAGKAESENLIAAEAIQNIGDDRGRRMAIPQKRKGRQQGLRLFAILAGLNRQRLRSAAMSTTSTT